MGVPWRYNFSSDVRDTESALELTVGRDGDPQIVLGRRSHGKFQRLGVTTDCNPMGLYYGVPGGQQEAFEFGIWYNMLPLCPVTGSSASYTPDESTTVGYMMHMMQAIMQDDILARGPIARIQPCDEYERYKAKVQTHVTRAFSRGMEAPQEFRIRVLNPDATEL